jgi:cytochrome c biogenesis protein
VALHVPFQTRKGKDMVASLPRKIWQALGAIKTGVILLIVVVIFSAAGTIVLQRSTTQADEMQRAYSPEMLRLLDGLGLTDVFHAWWFVLLLGLVSLSIIAASIQRFPNAWRFYARPYKSPDERFRAALPTQKTIPIKDEEVALSVADHVLQKKGFPAERIVRENSFSLFAERHRISEMAVYVVHASLLLIFLGGIIDAEFGWRAFLSLNRGEQANQVRSQDGAKHDLAFSIRCDSAGQENYSDGSPKRWWSNLTVLKDGQEVMRKQIAVNEPLVYQGIRFYQASYGFTGKLDNLTLTARTPDGNTIKDITLRADETASLDADATVRLAEFIPDYVVEDGHVYARSGELVNPAAHLVVESKKSGRAADVWLPPIPGQEKNASFPYTFEGKNIQMAYFTGLEVSHEPGQWAVWAGVILMGFGLAVVFYLVHSRIWVVPVRDESGYLQLWIGGAANKNRDAFEQRFHDVVNEIESELELQKNGEELPAVLMSAN